MPAKLKIVKPNSRHGNAPPRPLGKEGRLLWDRITKSFDVADAGGVELLLQACEATDFAAALRKAIVRDGQIIHTRNGMKMHPAVRAELSYRSFITRTLARMGLDLEPLRETSGRPPKNAGWIPEMEDEE
jgi:hypothetical protein